MNLSSLEMERLLSKRKIDEATKCWIWTGAVDSGGYGKIGLGYKTLSVKRVIMNAKEGEQVNHKLFCHNRLCFNPEHLYIGIASDNVKDAWKNGAWKDNKRKDICKNGHLLDSNNTTTGYRYCSICKRERDKRRALAGEFRKKYNPQRRRQIYLKTGR